jgi:hypothetical protein
MNAPVDVLAVQNPYGLRERTTGFYVVVSQVDGTRVATHWTSKEERAREHVRRQGHYGVRMAKAENVELSGGRA